MSGNAGRPTSTSSAGTRPSSGFVHLDRFSDPAAPGLKVRGCLQRGEND